VHKREREDLAIHFLRIVAAVRPRFVLRENPSVTRPGAAWPWQRFRAGLESLGYSVLPFRVRACCLGLDHQRERLFLLAELPNTNSQRPQRLDWSRVEAGHAGGEAGRLQRHHDISSPRFCRGTDGVPARVDRLVGAGNAVAPSVAEWIGRRLMESA
jgi:site-specific DNA-cytosine methylase